MAKPEVLFKWSVPFEYRKKEAFIQSREVAPSTLNYLLLFAAIVLVIYIFAIIYLPAEQGVEYLRPFFIHCLWIIPLGILLLCIMPLLTMFEKIEYEVTTRGIQFVGGKSNLYWGKFSGYRVIPGEKGWLDTLCLTYHKNTNKLELILPDNELKQGIIREVSSRLPEIPLELLDEKFPFISRKEYNFMLWFSFCLSIVIGFFLGYFINREIVGYVFLLLCFFGPATIWMFIFKLRELKRHKALKGLAMGVNICCAMISIMISAIISLGKILQETCGA